MNEFHWPRFVRVLRNDLLQQWKKIWIATLALAGLGLISYLLNVDPAAVTRPALHEALFAMSLLGGGLLFTSTIFADLHHPLQRFQYLTLPCSNLERFVSRYLLSAPLFYLYLLVVYAVFDWTAAAIAEAVLGAKAAPFAPFGPAMRELAWDYFVLHALTFCGAIFFRSHQAIKTLLSVTLVGFGLAAVTLGAFRLFYWNYFVTLLQPGESGIPLPVFEPTPRMVTFASAAFSLWVLFIAYRCLREHEVQGEL